MKKIIVFILSCFCFVFSINAQDVEMPEVSDVKISGNKFVSTALIKKQLRTQKGRKFSRIDINKDLKRLYQLNYFNKIDVEIDESNGSFTIIFIVEEKFVIDRIIFKGNKKYKSKSLRDSIDMLISEDQLLNENFLSQDIAKIKEYYQEKGYKQIAVTHNVVSYPEEGIVDVEFLIEEGKKTRIKEINILGITKFKSKKILKIMKTKKKRFFNSGFFDEEKFSTDLEMIKAFYYQKGFIDIKILNVEEKLAKDKSKLIINIYLNEGNIYKIGEVNIEGNKTFSNDELIYRKGLIEGEDYLPQNLSSEMKQIKNYYLKNGYIDAKVGVKTHVDPSQKDLLNVTFQVMENEVAFINKIIVVGNDKTKDIVVRRELNLDPGQKFDGVKVDIAKRRLTNLGLFKNVDIYPDPTTNDKDRDLFVEVEEDRTGELGFGAGYSSVDHLIGFLEVSQSNFDLFNFPSFTGAAQKLKFRSEFGKYKKSLEMDFTEPWLLNKRLLFGFNVVNSEREYEDSDYSEKREGFSVRVARPIFKFSRGEIKYSFENILLENVPDTASEYLKEQEGERDIGKIGFSIIRDVRDSFFNATQGSKLSMSLEMAGVGGDTEYYRGVLSGDLYFNPWFNNVFIFSLRVGAIKEFGDSDDVPIFERFFLGGAWSIRGFDYRDIGPHDSLGEPLGGKFMYYGTMEYVIPLVEQFRFAMFYDFGNLYDEFENVDFDIINSSVGVGFRIMLNQQIPLRFDYAWPMSVDDYHEDEGGKFTFDIGHRF